jgi:hypothetical protein
MDKINIQNYELNVDNKPYKIIMNDELSLEEEGKRIKKEEDEKLKIKIEELNKLEVIDNPKQNLNIQLRTIVLTYMGINPLIHLSELSERQKKLYNKKAFDIIDKYSKEEIFTQFAEIVNDEIFSSNKDYTKYFF